MDVSLQVSLLGELNQADKAIWALEDEAAARPRELRAREEALQEKKRAREAAEAGHAARDRERRAREKELLEVEARARRAEENADRVTNQAQYDASQREVQALRERADALGEEALALIDEVDALARGVAEARAAEGAAAAERDDLARTAAARLAAIDGELSGRRSERDRVAGEMDPAVLARYRRAVASPGARGGVTVCRDGVCQTCRRQVPPQILNEAEAFRALHACPSCGRLILNVLRPEAAGSPESA
ncbi:hypothetical protein L6R50_18310 [Myxococcota bacterium]|nr:hypothetical protein [Myxococcota bacterium]